MMMRQLALVWGLGLAIVASAQTCTTQSAMAAGDRDALAQAAVAVAVAVQANDAAGLKSLTAPELAKDFGGVVSLVAATAPRLKGLTAVPEQVYLLDATGLAASAETQFDCSLNKSARSVSFSIPQLPAGRYGFAMVRFPGQSPWQVSMLLQSEGGRWLMAGLYPKAMTAGGHDGDWYWTTARTMLTDKHAWDAWLYYQEAEQLLQPAGFVTSTHLDKLGTELTEAAPPPVKGGLSAAAPLVVKGADGAEFRFTSLGVDDSLETAKPDIAAHIKVDTLGDAAAARKRNDDAAVALLGAHPELRESFHGVLMVAEVAGQTPYVTEQSMTAIR